MLMKFWTGKRLKSEKGNAMLMALSVILVLTAFGTASLMTSVANIQMSSKFKNWSKDYYALDQNAENKVNQFNQLLETAESNAQKYMTDECYLIDPNDPNYPTGITSGLQVTLKAQSYIFSQWQNNVQPYLEDRSSSTYQQNQQSFTNDTLKRLYYYYASNLLDPDGTNPSVTYQIDSPGKGEYQSELFDSWDTIQQAEWEKGKLLVGINSKDTPDPIPPDTVNGKVVSVKINILFPIYAILQQTRKVKGNPIWTNAITAAGSIGFENGSSTIQGDLFSADKDESLYLNDNEVNATGVYSDGANVDIQGNVYSKGNLHIIRSGSTINVSNYPPGFPTALKNKVFSNNGLFFDDSDNASDPYPTDYMYIQKETDPDPLNTLYFVNQDKTGGNIYCNSLTVDHTVDNQRVNNGTINANGNVSTFNDIKMNNTGSITDGSGSKILVAKNFIGVNSSAHNGDPNANSTVINNTALAGNKIFLNGKIIVPGTAWAEYAGVKKNTPIPLTSYLVWPRFFWPSTNPNLINPWLSQQYYQTGESITAKNANIYGAYMGTVNNPIASYNYSYEPFTLDTDPQHRVPPELYDEPSISSFYLMRGDNKVDPTDLDSLIPKKSQLVNYLISNNSLISNIYVGSTITGYSLAEALLHSDNALSANLYGDNILNPPADPLNLTEPDPRLKHIKDINDFSGSSGYADYYKNFKRFLSKIFLSKVQNLGTLKRLPISLENFVDKSYGYIASPLVENFVIKSAVLDINENLLPGINTVPIGKQNSFSYLQPLSGSDTVNLNFSSDSSGIIYCAGNLNISGIGTFKGAIICEGNVTVAAGATITYDKEVIQNVFDTDDVANNFFSKLSCFENPADKSKGFIDKSTVLNSDGSLRSDIESDPSGMRNSFVYIQPPTGTNTTSINFSGNSSGIIYCEGNLNISGSGTFNGAIICEGNVTVSGDSTITYDEGVIQSVLGADSTARRFFTPGEMGLDTDISYSTTASSGAVRQANIKRYLIIEWKEEQQ